MKDEYFRVCIDVRKGERFNVIRNTDTGELVPPEDVHKFMQEHFGAGNKLIVGHNQSENIGLIFWIGDLPMRIIRESTREEALQESPHGRIGDAPFYYEVEPAD